MFTWNLISDITWQIIVYFACVFLASIVRGCIGFGFSIIVIASTALFLDPALLVPTLIMLEIVASIYMLASVWKSVLWKETAWITLGLLIGIPIGTYILSNSPIDTLRLIAAFSIFILTLCVLKEFSYKFLFNKKIYFTVGVFSGFFSGVAAAGGIVAATCLLMSSLPMRQVRATLVIYLFVTGFIFLISSFVTGGLDIRSFNMAIVTIIPMFVGIHIGSKLYRFLDEDKLCRLVFIALFMLSVIGVIRAISVFI